MIPTVKLDLGRDLLKILAIALMTVDHVGVILYPEFTLLHAIGRLAFPLFAYLLVLGVDSTRNPWKYMAGLLVFAFVAQVPYFLAFGIQPLERFNILFTLSLSALTLFLLLKKNVLCIVPLIVYLLINVESGIYGVAFVLFLKLLERSPKIGALALVTLNIPFFFAFDIQGLSLFALPIIVVHEKGWIKKEVTVNRNLAFSVRKYAFYLFYPLHLAVLFLVKTLFF